MLHKCANPVCPNQFRSLSHGKLFLVETDPRGTRSARAAVGYPRGRWTRQVERFWLCDRCSLLLTLTIERGHGMVAVPASAKGFSAAAKRYRYAFSRDVQLAKPAQGRIQR